MVLIQKLESRAPTQTPKQKFSLIFLKMYPVLQHCYLKIIWNNFKPIKTERRHLVAL